MGAISKQIFLLGPASYFGPPFLLLGGSFLRVYEGPPLGKSTRRSHMPHGVEYGGTLTGVNCPVIPDVWSWSFVSNKVRRHY